MKFQYPESLSLAQLPTPIQKLEKLSAAWGGPELYIKRDDLTGCALSGNKIRKLEFSLAEARAQGADTLITCGGAQSNHARATAVAGARLGLSSLLLLRGVQEETGKGIPKPAGAPTGNLLLDELVGAEVCFITPEDYKKVNELMAETADELKRRGKHPYIIPEGASNEIGYFGYIRAAEEIAGQLEAMNLDVDVIVCATGSGGTLGGLELGKRLLGLKPQPVGINVCDTAAKFQERMHKVITDMIAHHEWDLELPREKIQLIDGYVGKGYALSRPEELALMQEVARMEGIILDPVYTGKAMFGLKDRILQRQFTSDQKILFLHTGGIFGLLA